MSTPKTQGRVPRWRAFFDVTATLAMIGLAATLVWQSRGPARASETRAGAAVEIPREPVAITGSAARGSTSAKVAIIEYADFECPSCAQFAKTTEPVLFRDYVDTGRVLFVFKHFPLAIHPGAPAAAQAAWCADKQGKFWEFAGQLFRIRGSLEDADLTAAGTATSLNSADFETCRTAEQSAHHVQSERAEGERLQVPGTPTFFIGLLRSDGRVNVSDALLGAKPIEEFQAILERLLGN